MPSSADLAVAALCMDEVSVRFADIVALDRVSLVVPSGGITGLLGRNGAGKSTSIRVLAGLVAPDTGSVSVLGRSLASDRIEALRQTGYLLAEPALFSYLTPRETLRFIGECNGLPRIEAEERAASLLSFFALDGDSDRLVDQLSTGTAKRLSLAAALVHAPTLLVLDEPFEGLDPLMVRSVKQLLRDFVAAGGTVLLSSHLIDVVEEICDNIVILEKGRVVVSGKTAEAKRRAAQETSGGSLEDLYASLVVTASPTPDWLTRSTRSTQ